jgi:hypothetical protein
LGEFNTGAGETAVGLAKTLAERLREGPLGLSYALQCATDIAGTIYELHEEGRMHGGVAPEFVQLRYMRAQLLPLRGRARYAEPAGDVAAFGAVLYEMVHGVKLNVGEVVAASKSDGDDGILAAIARLSARCIRTASNSPAEMQQVLAEVRLLAQQAKAIEIESAPTARPATLIPSALAPGATARSPLELEPELAPLPPRRRQRDVANYRPVEPKSFMAETGASIADPTPSGVRCPRCGVPYVYPSRPRTWIEALFAAWKSPPQRCHRCLFRYLTLFGKFHLEKGSPNPEAGPR